MPVTLITNKPSLQQKALILPQSHSKTDPAIIIPITEQDFKSAESLAKELLDKYGFNPAQIDAALTKAEDTFLAKQRMLGARKELRRKIEDGPGGGMWVKKNGHWVLKPRYRGD